MKNKNKTLLDINTVLIALLVIVMAAGLYFTLSVPGPKAPEPAPAPLSIAVTVLGTECTDCWDVNVALGFLAQQKNINITSVTNISLKDTAEVAAKYNVTRLPAVIVTGEVSNLTIQNFEMNNDALVFSSAPPPYYSLAEKRYVGKVSLTVLDEQTCAICFNMTALVEQLEQTGIKIVRKTLVKPSSAEGKALVDKYSVEKLPSIILSKDALQYDFISQVWPSVGSEEPDGNLVLRMVYPPFVNVSNGNVEGQVELTVIEDATCAECYNTSILTELFKNGLNMNIKDTKRIDVTSTRGKLLLKKYNITAVPTVVASKDTQHYAIIYEVWNQLGTIEKDGSLVLRQIAILEKALGTPVSYRNLTSGAIETSSTAPATDAEITAPTVEE